MLLRHFEAQSERLDEPKALLWKVLLSHSANLHEEYLWKYTKTSIMLHYLCSWQRDWLIDIPLPALHRWGGVINTQRVRCSRRAPCFLTVMHSNPVSPLRASATFSSNRSRIKPRSLSTPRIYHQLKSLQGNRILKPVAATPGKSKIKSRARAVGWTFGIRGAAATSLNASRVLPAHLHLAQEGAVGSGAQGGLFWGFGRALFSIPHRRKVSGSSSPAFLFQKFRLRCSWVLIQRQERSRYR